MRTQALRFAGLYVGFVFVLLALLIGSHLIPDGRIADQLVQARADGEFSATNWVLTRPANLEDKFADCFGASQGLGNNSIIESALRSPNLGSCPSANAKLDAYVATGELTHGWEYYRYWHGYTVVTRPSIAVFGLGGTRYLLTALIAVATAAVAYLATKRSGNVVAAVMIVPLAATTDLLWMASSIPTAVGVVAALAGPILILAGPRLTPDADLANDGHVMRRVLIAGGIVPFADLLSVGPISWALTVMAVALMLARPSVTNRRSMRLVGLAAVVWMVGYAATWAAKWVFSAFVVGVSDTWFNVRQGVTFRLDGEHELVDPSLFRTSDKTFRYWLEQPYAPHMLIATLCIVAASLYLQRDRLQQWAQRFAIMAAPALLIIVWYEVVRNHSQIHHWLTYRYWAVFMGIVAAAALLGNDSAERSDVDRDATASVAESEELGPSFL